MKASLRRQTLIKLARLVKKGKPPTSEDASEEETLHGGRESEGTSAPVSLPDWYDLDQELILALERPTPAKDLFDHIEDNGGSLDEEKTKVILKQLVDAAVDLEKKHIFCRDIKLQNLLMETSSDVPRVRLIDFGLSCFVEKGARYRVFFGTPPPPPPEWYDRGMYRAGPTAVYQIGAVLFETLHSGAEFDTIGFFADDLRISNELSENCQDLLRTCLNQDPNQRPTLKQLRIHPWLQ
ncbi:serine/threonine-protein kinase pim-3-like [Cebidichthys violaceus]|uniref:serine/threonine-protein kinase pim-3-like n=1 Tax=Cebidichthys violaceus TaxID=271503 RepID=UPI0035CB94B9